MVFLKNERGIALVTSLMLTLLTLVIVTVLLYMVTTGIQVSAANKRYKNVVEAAQGGVSLTVNEFIPRLNNAIFGNYSSGSNSGLQKLLHDYDSSNINLAIQNSQCLRQKLDNATSNWGTACGAGSKDLDAKTNPDMTFVLKSSLTNTLNAQPGFIVYSKIVDTPVKGNTDKADIGTLRKGENVTESAEIEGTGVTIPTTYRIEVKAERQTNPQEKASMSVLYAY